MTPTEQYCKDVLSGKQLAGKWVRLAVERHIKDLETGHKRGLVFDPKAAHLVIGFTGLLNLYKGEAGKKGANFKLEPWQQFITSMVFGWKKKDGTRRFNTSYTEVARKNGKTTLLAGRAHAHLFLDGEAAPQVYAGATKEEQATIVVNDAGQIAKNTPFLNKRLDYTLHKGIYRRVFVKNGTGFIAPIGRDSKTLDGLDPSYGIMDEYHAHKTDELVNVINTGMGARKQPLLDLITTAGFNKNSPCFKKRQSICEILEGKIVDDNTFGIIFSLDEEDEWKDPSNWIKANPNLSVSVERQFLESQLVKAINEGGTTEVEYKTKNLNVWCDAEATWISDMNWLACKCEVPNLTGKKAYCGFDAASTTDITALSLIIPHESKLYLKTFYWVPEDLLKTSEGKKNNYLPWVQQGWLETTPGNVTDYGFIKKRLREIAEDYELVRIGYDKWNLTQTASELIEEGFPLAEFSQGIANMNAPTKELERIVLNGALAHDGNPVSRWMIGNITIRRDSNGNIKIDKDKSADKVDGPVSFVMALGEFMTGDEPETVGVDVW